ncbi:acetoacetate--CoA ligase [Bradyrhizobium macuxiense]|nr:acetoacetate--CoA ligase [Bradyrhizobium macuxiense]
MVRREPEIVRYRLWLAATRQLSFDSYDDLWRWSTANLEEFWQSIWDYFALRSPTPHTCVLAERRMPGAKWFPGATVNYVEQVFRHVDRASAAGLPAIVSRNEKGDHREVAWPDLRRQVASLALHLRSQGVQPGDRVVGYLPNIPEAIVAFLATASIGAVWSICAPDMGTQAVLDRFKQIEPKVLIACDGVTYSGVVYDRTEVLAQIRAALPSVRHVIVHENIGTASSVADCVRFDRVVSRDDNATASFEPQWLPFDHPLWIVYSSGTTGLPKPIVHGHGGTVIVALTTLAIHCDIGCSYKQSSFGERFHWYSSTGWVMWNAQIGGLLNGTTLCIYDGNPGGTKANPDWTTLWRFAADLKVSFFGVGAAFFANCMKAGVEFSKCGDLSSIRALGTTGSPLSEEVQSWGSRQFAALALSNGNQEQADIWWCNISGGTDFAGAFIGGNRELPTIPGEMQCRLLGCAVQTFDEHGKPVIDAVGELVCTEPIPSMPLFLWGDTDGKRLIASYFDTYPDNYDGTGRGPAWRHGDWLKITGRGTCIIYGRSDATINRHGLRMGTSELYRAVEALPEVVDSLVVDIEYLGRESFMPLFVALGTDVVLDEKLKGKINDAIRIALSPRFVPNAIYQVAEIPRTLSGKKQELPIKKLLLGQPLENVINKDAMANPGCLEWYRGFAEKYLNRDRTNA